MNNAQKISKMVERLGRSVQIFEQKRMFGFIPITLSRGWLWFKDVNDHWSVMLASDKTTHNSLNGPAYSADFRKDNGKRKIGPLYLTGTWISAFSTWPIVDEEKAIRTFNLIASKIDLAYRYYFAESA